MSSIRFLDFFAWTIPFLMQGTVMAVDEFYCHRRRILRKWERVGHPIDTFVFSLCFLVVMFLHPDYQWYATPVYFVMSAISCLLITKDEWEHQELCTGFESWLHSLLFILHPVVLIWMWIIWREAHEASILLAAGMFMVTVAYGFYQLFYWNFRRDQ